jgi:hypothetical protein
MLLLVGSGCRWSLGVVKWTPTSAVACHLGSLAKRRPLPPSQRGPGPWSCLSLVGCGVWLKPIHTTQPTSFSKCRGSCWHSLPQPQFCCRQPHDLLQSPTYPKQLLHTAALITWVSHRAHKHSIPQRLQLTAGSSATHFDFSLRSALHGAAASFFSNLNNKATHAGALGVGVQGPPAQQQKKADGAVAERAAPAPCSRAACCCCC